MESDEAFAVRLSLIAEGSVDEEHSGLHGESEGSLVEPFVEIVGLKGGEKDGCGTTRGRGRGRGGR